MKSLNVVCAMVAVFMTSGPVYAGSSGPGEATAGAAKTEHTVPTERVLAKRSSRAGGRAQWGYHGAEGPDAWAELSPEFEACGSGMAQSPINVSSASDGASALPIEFDYNLTPINVLHNGHTIQQNYQPGSGITVGGKRYELLQFYFHTPSEHAVEDRRATMEVHFVHRRTDGQLAVVAVLLDSGASNPALAEIWQHMPVQKSPANVNPDVLVNGRDLLPQDKSYYRYMGSLTTPPCSEGVNVMQQAVSVGIQQAAQFADAVGNNARPLQAKNSRLILSPSIAN